MLGSSPTLLPRYDTLAVMLKATEVKPIIIRPEDILAPKEAETLQLADRGELLCPRCGQNLYSDKLIAEGIYEGVVLVCWRRCGWYEY